MGLEDLLGGKKKYKVGDKITFYEGFNSHEYEITSKKGANAVNKYQPKTHAEFKAFTRRKR